MACGKKVPSGWANYNCQTRVGVDPKTVSDASAKEAEQAQTACVARNSSFRSSRFASQAFSETPRELFSVAACEEDEPLA